jgi:hypothetical protein
MIQDKQFKFSFSSKRELLDYYNVCFACGNPIEQFGYYIRCKEDHCEEIVISRSSLDCRRIYGIWIADHGQYNVPYICIYNQHAYIRGINMIPLLINNKITSYNEAINILNTYNNF